MTTYELIVATDVDFSEGRAYVAALAEDDTPMDLATAIWLPELLDATGFPRWSVTELRGAIARCDLRPERHGRAIVVTKRHLREWREACRIDQPTYSARGVRSRSRTPRGINPNADASSDALALLAESLRRRKGRRHGPAR